MYSLSELSIFPSILLFSLWGIGGWLMLSSHLEVLPNELSLVGFGLGLFVSEPLKPTLKNDMGGTSSEENDSCMIWVAAPTLCYYEPIFKSKDVHVQLLVPWAYPARSQAAQL